MKEERISDEEEYDEAMTARGVICGVFGVRKNGSGGGGGGIQQGGETSSFLG